MKTMICSQMGGACDKELSADTSADMAKEMTAHVMEAHPDVAKKMESMTPDEHKEWEAKFHADWDAAPEA